MKRYRQFAPVVMADFEVAEWQHPEHNHNHYELIYIKHGTGQHVINQQAVSYSQGDVFLLGPEEAHYFEVHTPTRFVYLKFTDAYLHQAGNSIIGGIQSLEYLIKSRETHQSRFHLSPEDQHTVDLLFNVLLALKQDIQRNESLIWIQLLAISSLLQRNMPALNSLHRSKEMQAVFCYIHKYIYQPDQLRAPVMAASFNMSGEYIGPYFKKHTGTTLRDYIRDYRNHLIKQRMASGQFSLKQIAAEFGLTDQSHVLKLLQPSGAA
ncbi:AraC family transcriptional regulator [Chitinophaga nivalis]|uniref:AraC family transcriptional regulator n=1 Tax=Chitinophaga nivalis TaxID=2991709 RepID=A0ABT3IMD1_9BACT|nr:AraC family transcriptional regulator [Chitinophaga nivalis]MCW3465193.1 AraC family transcriptional regulator [Chitinophaga nivalis]MCW3485115.1 AraC family transcriptional regulator [Chitinophaga nivalis]